MRVLLCSTQIFKFIHIQKVSINSIKNSLIKLNATLSDYIANFRNLENSPSFEIVYYLVIAFSIIVTISLTCTVTDAAKSVSAAGTPSVRAIPLTSSSVFPTT